MSFDQRSQGVDWESARRQFRLSLFLVVALLFAAIALGSALPTGISSAERRDDASKPSFGRLADMQE
jgi:hypothetical protein